MAYGVNPRYADISDITYNQHTVLTELSRILYPIFLMKWEEYFRKLTDNGINIRAFCNTGTQEQIRLLLCSDFMQSKFADYWEGTLHNGIISVSDFKSVFNDYPQELNPETVIQCGSDTDIICVSDNRYILKKETVRQYISRTEFPLRQSRRNDTKEIMDMFFSGNTLQKVGDAFGMTREGIRLVINRQFHNFPVVFEDGFAEPFQTFKFDTESFLNVFPEAKTAGYKYLSMRYKRGSIPFTEENAAGYSGFWNDRISGYFEKYAEEHRKPPTVKESVSDILNENINMPMTREDVYSEYLRKANGKPASYISIYNAVTQNMSLVANKWNQYRVYTGDPQVLWDTVDFERYKDTIISAELICRQYPDILERLQVSDSHELYYVIRNTVDDYYKGSLPIRCRRVPTLIIGNMTYADQAVNLLKEYSRISHADYYDVYAQRYGVPREIACGNHDIKNALAPYDCGGIYLNPNLLADSQSSVKYTAKSVRSGLV